MSLAKLTIAYGEAKRYKLNYHRWLRKGEILISSDAACTGEGTVSSPLITINLKSVEVIYSPDTADVGTNTVVTVGVTTSQGQTKIITLDFAVVAGITD